MIYQPNSYKYKNFIEEELSITMISPPCSMSIYKIREKNNKELRVEIHKTDKLISKKTNILILLLNALSKGKEKYNNKKKIIQNNI